MSAISAGSRFGTSVVRGRKGANPMSDPRCREVFSDLLESGRVVYLESSTSRVFSLVNTLILDALSEAEGTAVLVDGCNSVDPYKLARLCKRTGRDQRDALERLVVSRAFTAYQMSAIIEEELERRLDTARLLVVSGMQYLYQDKDMDEAEAKVLASRAFRHVRELAERYGLVAVVTDIKRRVGRQVLRAEDKGRCRHVVLTRRNGRLRVRDVNAGRVSDHEGVPWYQTRLDDFGSPL